jgi:hypothetical protein
MALTLQLSIQPIKCQPVGSPCLKLDFEGICDLEPVSDKFHVVTIG